MINMTDKHPVLVLIQAFKRSIENNHGDKSKILEIKVNKELYNILRGELVKLNEPPNLGIKIIRGEE